MLASEASDEEAAALYFAEVLLSRSTRPPKIAALRSRRSRARAYRVESGHGRCRLHFSAFIDCAIRRCFSSVGNV